MDSILKSRKAPIKSLNPENIKSQFYTGFGREAPPGESHPAAGPVSVSENAGGNDLTEGLEHALQLLLIHGHWQVGDVQVGGVLLLLLKGKELFLSLNYTLWVTGEGLSEAPHTLSHFFFFYVFYVNVTRLLLPHLETVT